MSRALVCGFTVVVVACGSDQSSVLPRADPDTTSTSVPTGADDAPTSTVPEASRGLVSCSTVPRRTTDVLGERSLASQDVHVLGVLQTYAAERPETFGGLWIDQEALGTVVLAFTDDPEPHLAALRERAPSEDDISIVEPPEPIVDRRAIGERDDVFFDVIRVEHTEAELRDLQRRAGDIAFASDFGFSGAGTDIVRNRVSLSPDDGRLAADEAAALAAELSFADLDLSKMCIDGEILDGSEPPPPFAPGDELDVIVLPAPDGTYPADEVVACGGLVFRLGDLDDRGPVSDADPDLRSVVEESIELGTGGGSDPSDWEVLSIENDRAVLVHFAFDGTGAMASAELGPNGWVWDGSSGLGDCTVRRLLPQGLSLAEWELAPGAAVGPDVTSIELLATERSCASGQEMGERLLPPDIVETEDAIRIVVAAVALTGDQACPSNPASPVTITLDAPLGDRKLLDGLTIGSLSDLLAD